MKIKDHFYSQDDFEVTPSKYKGILETLPKLSEDELSSYYNHENYISHKTKSNSVVDKFYLLSKQIMVKRKRNMVNAFCSSGQILDVGTGTGDFLKAFNPNNWNRFAIEPNRDLHDALISEGITILEHTNAIIHHKFDVITLWHALEHIPDLEHTLETIQSSLTPNGVLLIAVPNYNSYDAKFYKFNWAAWDVPRHVWHFSKQGLINFCKPFGFDFVKTKPLLLDAFYISILSERYRKSNNLIRAFFIGLASNIYGGIKNEYSSFLYVFKNRRT